MEVNLNEQQLLMRLRAGDASAFQVVYENYGKRLFLFSRSLNLSVEDAQEIVQETFIRVWNSRQTIDLSYSFNAWLMTIARNLIYNQIRKDAVRMRYFNALLSTNRVESDVIQHDELQRIVEAQVADLPEKCQEVFRLSRFAGYSNQQIAEHLHISKSTVENHLNKALKHMRAALAKYGYSAGVLFLVIHLFLKN